APLVRALAQALPDHHVLVTCTTAAGRETVKQVYGETVLAAYLPFDFPEPVQRFLEHFRPRLGVLMETEVWPNLLAGCAQNGVPRLDARFCCWRARAKARKSCSWMRCRRGTASSWSSSSRAIRSASRRSHSGCNRAGPALKCRVTATSSIWETRWARCRSTSAPAMSR